MLKTFFRWGCQSLLLAMVVSSSSQAAATTLIGPKHIYILNPGVDAIWGSYVFVVNNDSQQPETYSFPVMLPKETVDFQAQDALSAQELKLGADGGITIDKAFPPGETLMQISFKLPANQGSAAATFKAPYPYQTIGLFVGHGSIEVNGPSGLEIQNNVNLSGRMFDSYSLGAGESGKTISYAFEGVPEGRGRLWVVGGIFAGILLVTGLTIAFFTRPHSIQGEVVV